jgi:hypothetical protein
MVFVAQSAIARCLTLLGRIIVIALIFPSIIVPNDCSTIYLFTSLSSVNTSENKAFTNLEIFSYKVY